MADLNKVSKTVQNFVSEVQKLEGAKKKIDSVQERMLLSDYLSGNALRMNQDEREFIEGYIIEYDKSREKQFIEENVTNNTKKEIDKILKRMGDKKRLDSDEEAQALLLMLRDTHNDLNQADRDYITHLIITSGYGHYFAPKEVPPVNVTIVVQNPVAEDKNENQTNGAETPVKTEEPKTQTNNSVKKRKQRLYNPNRPRKTIPKPNNKPESPKPEPEPKKYKVSEVARTQGFGIANKIEEELHDTITNAGLIKDEFKKINRQNAYSFVGKMIEITDSHSVLTDVRKYVTYSEFKRVAACLLNQALDIGLSGTTAYKNLKAEYELVSRQQQKNPNKTPDTYDTGKLNAALRTLYNEMSKVYK